MNQDQKDKLAKFAEATEGSVNALIKTVTLMGETIDAMGHKLAAVEERVNDNETSINNVSTLLTTTDKLRNQFLATNDEATKQEFLRLLSDHVRKAQ